MCRNDRRRPAIRVNRRRSRAPSRNSYQAGVHACRTATSSSDRCPCKTACAPPVRALRRVAAVSRAARHWLTGFFPERVLAGECRRTGLLRRLFLQTRPTDVTMTPSVPQRPLSTARAGLRMSP